MCCIFVVIHIYIYCLEFAVYWRRETSIGYRESADMNNMEVDLVIKTHQNKHRTHEKQWHLTPPQSRVEKITIIDSAVQ